MPQIVVCGPVIDLTFGGSIGHTTSPVYSVYYWHCLSFLQGDPPIFRKSHVHQNLPVCSGSLVWNLPLESLLRYSLDVHFKHMTVTEPSKSFFLDYVLQLLSTCLCPNFIRHSHHHLNNNTKKGSSSDMLWKACSAHRPIAVGPRRTLCGGPFRMAHGPAQTLLRHW